MKWIVKKLLVALAWLYEKKTGERPIVYIEKKRVVTYFPQQEKNDLNS